MAIPFSSGTRFQNESVIVIPIYPGTNILQKVQLFIVCWILVIELILLCLFPFVLRYLLYSVLTQALTMDVVGKRKETNNFEFLTEVVKKVIPFMNVFRFVIYLLEQIIDVQSYVIVASGSAFFIIVSTYAFIHETHRRNSRDKDLEQSVTSQLPSTTEAFCSSIAFTDHE